MQCYVLSLTTSFVNLFSIFRLMFMFKWTYKESGGKTRDKICFPGRGNYAKSIK